MTETPPDYISNADHGDETDARPKETPMSGKSNTQYTLTGSDGDAPPGPWVARVDAAAVAYWQAQAAQAHAKRDAVTRQLAEAEAHNTDLMADATRFLAERDAALAQLASVKRQLAQTSDTLAAERRTAATQRR